LGKQTNRPFSKEDFRKEFVVNILIGFIAVEVALLFLLGHIERSEFTIIAIPFLSLYFISKIGFYKYSIFFGAIFICIISLIPFITKNAHILPTITAISLAMILIYSLTNTWYALLYLLAIATMGLASKDIALLDSSKVETILQYLFFPLAIGVTLCVGWLPNQRLREALRKVQRTEYLLEMERNMLDTRIKQRTEALLRLADLGTAAQRLVHDIATPLNTILMNVSQITPGNIKMAQKAIRRAQIGVQTMTSYVEEVRNKIRNQDNRTWFKISKVIETTKHICEMDKIKVIFSCVEELELYGNESKLLQILVNITQNSVEAYEANKGVVHIKARCTTKGLVITIVDKGKGIDPELLANLGSFTTKDDHVLNGIGYHAAVEIVENDFSGKLITKNTTGKGTKTTIQIGNPVRTGSDLAHQPVLLPS
jgi:signal transduction histidine kinase